MAVEIKQAKKFHRQSYSDRIAALEFAMGVAWPHEVPELEKRLQDEIEHQRLREEESE